MSYHNKIEAAIYGHLIGDAFGVPYEFKKAERLPEFEPINLSMTPPANFARSWKAIPPGTWSDDGAQMLILTQNIIQNGGKYEQSSFIKDLLEWRYGSYMWMDGKNFDCGIQTSDTLEQIRLGKQVSDLEFSKMSNGNGSLMRCLPIGLYFKTEDITRLARAQSMVTHGHEISVVCCALYCHIVSLLVQGLTFTNAIATATQRMWDDESLDKATVSFVIESSGNEPEGSGYVVDSLWSAIWAVDGSNTFNEAIARAVMLGNDTDTTACIAGGMAGALYGNETFSSKLCYELRGKDIVQKILIGERI